MSYVKYILIKNKINDINPKEKTVEFLMGTVYQSGFKNGKKAWGQVYGGGV